MHDMHIHVVHTIYTMRRCRHHFCTIHLSAIFGRTTSVAVLYASIAGPLCINREQTCSRTSASSATKPPIPTSKRDGGRRGDKVGQQAGSRREYLQKRLVAKLGLLTIAQPLQNLKSLLGAAGGVNTSLHEKRAINTFYRQLNGLYDD